MNLLARFEELFSLDIELGRQCWNTSWFKTEDFLWKKREAPYETHELIDQVEMIQKCAKSLMRNAQILYQNHKRCLETSESESKANDQRWKVIYELCHDALSDLTSEEAKLFQIMMPRIIEGGPTWLDRYWFEGLQRFLTGMKILLMVEMRAQRFSLKKGWKERGLEFDA